MNISEFHDSKIDVSAKPIFKTTEGKVNAMQILENALLKEHITQVPALLVCVVGKVIFENENGVLQTLAAGDYIHIEPLVKHWVKGVHDSQLLLIK